MSKIMILAPHPDDEILGCAGVIQNSANTENIHIVLATNGDFYGRDYAAVRLQESLAALRYYSLDDSHLTVMGFGDTGMDREQSFLSTLYAADTDVVTSTPLSAQTYHPLGGRCVLDAVPYTRRNFLVSLSLTLEKHRPDIVYVSSRYDEHGDHSALCLFLDEILPALPFRPIVRQYIVHGGDDTAWPNRESHIFSRPPVCDTAIWEKRVVLSGVDWEAKRNALRIFESQLSPSGFLLSFAKTEEFFLE